MVARTPGGLTRGLVNPKRRSTVGPTGTYRAPSRSRPKPKPKRPVGPGSTNQPGVQRPPSRGTQRTQPYIYGLGPGVNAERYREGRIGRMQDQGYESIGVPMEWQPEGANPGWIPIYYEGDQFDAPVTSPEDIARLQVELVQAGLLTQTYRRGIWDTPTQEAYYLLLTFTNQGGEQFGMGPGSKETAWRKGLDILKENPDTFDQMIPEFVPEVYLAPNPEAIKQGINQSFNSYLGRDPTEMELRQYQGIFEQEHRKAYDESVERSRAEYEHDATQGEQTDAERIAFGDEGATNRAEIPEGKTRDPSAEMWSEFVENKKPEKEMRQAQEDFSESSQTLNQGFDLIRSMIGGLR